MTSVEVGRFRARRLRINGAMARMQANRATVGIAIDEGERAMNATWLVMLKALGSFEFARQDIVTAPTLNAEKSRKKYSRIGKAR